ncbi:MAG: Fic family protein [Candidatus Doudnabacteria bacterium]|nr:Fic family protein [Candidatus Doudnabacteria bacterium]
MTYLDNHLKERIDAKLKQLQHLRPLPAAAVEKLRQQFAIEMTYNSNAIEGNRLTLKETFLVINEGLTIKGKPLKDHLEAKDHYEALNYLYESIEHNKKHTLSEVFIRSLQNLVVKDTDLEYAGKYRISNVSIGGSDHVPPDATEVPALMRVLLNWIRQNHNKIHPIELAALLHHKIVHIHPFYDGNGRAARLVMNVLLMQAGYPLVVILKNDRKKYYDALDKADKGKPQSFVQFVAQAVERSMNIYLKTLIPSKQKKEKYLLLSELAKQTPYSDKYLNLLARAGKIEAHKEKRNWLTTLEAIHRYQQNRQRQR